MTTSRIAFCLTALSLAAVGCSHDKPLGAPDGGAQADGGTAAGTQEPTCTTELATNKPVNIDTMGTAQLQSSVAFDGAIWVAYDQADADGSGGFDIWATRLGCDGSVLTPPFHVNTAKMSNDLDPVIVAKNGLVLIAWLTDDGNFPNNLTIRYRLYKSDGTAVMNDERKLQTNHAGTPADANAWEASVGALPEGFAIAGTRAPLDMGGWQAFVQFIDTQGNPVGNTIDASAEMGVDHHFTALTASEEGTLFWSWGRQKGGVDLPVVHAQVQKGATTALPDPPPAATAGRTGSYPSMAMGWGVNPPAYLAYQANLDNSTTIVVTNGSTIDESTPMLELGSTTENSFAPTVAGAAGGGAVAWIAQSRSAQSLAVQRFGYDGQQWQMGAALRINAQKGQVAPNQPGLVHLSGGTYFISWAEGTSPNYVLHGRFITLQ